MKVIVLELRSKQDEKWYEEVFKPLIDRKKSDVIINCYEAIESISLKKCEARDVSNILMALGIRTQIKGYAYIREAILKSIEDKQFFDAGITKSVYPYLAEKFKTTSSRAERAIRHAIESSWKKGEQNPEMLERIFGYSDSTDKEKPTNSEFLSKILDEIWLRDL